MFGGGRAAFESVHPRRRRPAARPLEQQGDGGGIALRQCLDAAAGEIAHPAGHPQALGLLLQGVAKTDALHTASNKQTNCLHV